MKKRRDKQLLIIIIGLILLIIIGFFIINGFLTGKVILDEESYMSFGIYTSYFENTPGFMTTYIELLNIGYRNVSTQLLFYDDSGNLIDSFDYTVNVGERKFIDTSNLFSSTKIGYVKINSTELLVDTQVLVLANKGGWEFTPSLPILNEGEYYASHWLKINSAWDTFYTILNPTNNISNFNITIYNALGEHINSLQFPVAPGQKIGGGLENLLAGSSETIGYAKIKAGQGLIVDSNLYSLQKRSGHNINFKKPSTIPQTLYTSYIMQGKDWTTFFVFVNTGSEDTYTNVTLYGKDGSVPVKINSFIEAGKMKVVDSNVNPSHGSGYAKIEIGKGVIADSIVLYKPTDARFEVEARQVPVPSTSYYSTIWAKSNSGNRLASSYFFLNTGLIPGDVTLTLYDNNGNELASETKSVPSKQIVAITSWEDFWPEGSGYLMLEMDPGMIHFSRIFNPDNQKGFSIEPRLVDYDYTDETIFMRHLNFDPLRTPLDFPDSLMSGVETGYYLVQLNQAVNDLIIDDLNNSGAEFLGDFELNVLLIKIDETKSFLENLNYVRWVDIYQPAYKLSRELYMMELTGELNNNSEIISLTIDVFENLSKVETAITNLGGEILENDTFIIADIAETKIKDMLLMPEILYIETYSAPQKLNNVATRITEVNTVANIGQPGESFLGLTGQNQIIGILDTGLDNATECLNLEDCSTMAQQTNLHQDFGGNRIIAVFENRRCNYDEAAPYSRRLGCDDGPADIGGINLFEPRRLIGEGGHGTHVAGSALGDGTMSNGVIRGPAYESQLVFQSVADNNGNFLILGTEAGALGKFNKYNPNIISNSWVTNRGARWSYSYSKKSQTIDRYAWWYKNITVLFGAGNQGSFDSSVSDEGLSKNVITIGASESKREIPHYSFIFQTLTNVMIPIFLSSPIQADNIDDYAGFSSHGDVFFPQTPESAWRTKIKPDVVAPGSWILSTRSHVCLGDRNESGFHGPDKQENQIIFDTDGIATHEECVSFGLPGGPVAGATESNVPLLPNAYPGAPSNLGEHYMYASGTSMATPHVAGIVALIRQYYTEIVGVNNPSAALLKATLINGAEAMTYGEPFKQPVPNNIIGWGRVNLTKSLRPCGDNLCIFFDDSSILTKTDSVVDYEIRVSESMPLEMTLVWTDAPRFTIDEKIVNRLDVFAEEISKNEHDEKSSLILHQGNKFDMDGSSINIAEITKGYGVDLKNNVQRIVVPRPENGFYRVRIDGDVGRFPLAPKEQPYALIISGIGGIDSTNSSGNYSYNFSVGEEVYAKGVGYPANKDVDVYIVEYDEDNNWEDDTLWVWNFAIHNTTVTTNDKGEIPNTLIWRADINGSFNIVVDLGQDKFYNPEKDRVDYPNNPGFIVELGDGCPLVTGAGTYAFEDETFNHAIYEDKVVWSGHDPDYSDSNYEAVFICDTSIGVKTKIDGNQFLRISGLDIYGTNVIWGENGLRLKMCDINLNGQDGGCLRYDAKSVIDDYWVEGAGISIWENRIVWSDGDNILLYDLGIDGLYGTGDDIGKIRITNSGENTYPEIYEKFIVWQRWDLDVTSNIYACRIDLNGQYGGCLENDEKIRVSSGGWEEYPQINGNIVAWTEGNFNSELAYCKIDQSGGYGGCLSGDIKYYIDISNYPNSNYPPRYGASVKDVWGDKIAWRIEGYPLGSPRELHIYDISTGQDIFQNPSSNYKVNLHENKVLWGSYDSGLYDMRLTVLDI